MAWGDAGTPVTAIGRAAAETLAFRVGGELHVAAVVKASFVLVPDRPMTLTDPEPILRADQHRDESPTSSLVAAGDLVPYRPRANVFLSGHARALQERPLPAMAVRLMVARGRDVLLDKRLAVRGAPDPSGRTREPAPFTVMRLAWELAAATPDNPAGIRESPGAWPHIVDPGQHDRAAGFGPISPRWPGRRRLFPAADSVLGARIPELPDDFAWAYFNAAPEDQRLDFLCGDEWVGFVGMSSQLPRVQSCLPSVRARASVYGAAPELRAGLPIPLEADTLSIDTDRLRCTVVWRGSFLVAREEDLATLHVFAGVETAGEPLAFPASYAVRAEHAPPVTPPPLLDDGSQTLRGFSNAPRAATPFEPHDAAPHGTTQAPAPPLDATSMLDLADLLRSVPALPFAPSVAPPPRQEARRRLPAATPFEKARVAPPPPATEPVTDSETLVFAADATVNLTGFLRPAPALPFAPSAAPPPRQEAPRSLPAATPFEQARLAAPPPPPPSGTETVDLASLIASPSPTELVPLTMGQQVVRVTPPEPSGSPPRPALATPTAEPPEGESGEPPRTLGGFFLAAMARAAKAPVSAC